MTAAESWRWEEEEAARSVPLGREMDMADVDFGGGGGRRPCRMCCTEGRRKQLQQQQTTVSAEDGDKPRRVQHKRPCVISLSTRHSHSPRSANTESPMTAGEPSSLTNRYRSDAGEVGRTGK